MGYGDGLIYLSLSFVFPYFDILPAIVDIFMNSIILSAIIPLILLIYNIKNIKYINNKKDIILLFVGYPKKKSEIKKFEIIIKDEKGYRILFNVEKTNFSKPSEKSEEIVWVTYGIPFVLFIFLGTIVYMFFNNILLKVVFIII